MAHHWQSVNTCWMNEWISEWLSLSLHSTEKTTEIQWDEWVVQSYPAIVRLNWGLVDSHPSWDHLASQLGEFYQPFTATSCQEMVWFPDPSRVLPSFTWCWSNTCPFCPQRGGQEPREEIKREGEEVRAGWVARTGIAGGWGWKERGPGLVSLSCRTGRRGW